MSLNQNERHLQVWSYPLYRGDVPSTSEEWLEKKRLRDQTEGLWRIHDGLYDFTDFIKLHPGGPQWITITKGTDITEAFEIHHLRGIAESYLKDYFVRKASGPRIQAFTFNNNGFYKTLKLKIVAKLSEIPRTVRKESNKITDILLITFLLLTPISCWVWNYNYLLGLILTIANSIVLSFLITSAHSYFHRADNWRMYLFNLNGQNFEQWRVSHSLSHHVFTNTSLDAEISFVEPFLQLLPYKDKPLWAQIAFFYWPLAGIFLFVRPVWRRLSRKTKTSEENTLKWIHIIQFFMPVWMYLFGKQSFLLTLLLWLVTSFLTSFFFVLYGLTAGHHTPDTIFEGDIPSDKSMDWGEYQMRAIIERAEYIGNTFMSITRFGDHGLHHLFPTLDQAELKHLYPILLDHCKEYGIEFKTTNFYFALVNMFLQLKRKGPKIFNE